MKWLKDVDIVYTSKSTFPGADIYNLFAGLESTVHAFYIPPRDKQAYKDTDFNQVTEQSKEILAGLAENSGGLFRTAAEPESDMAAIAAKVDSYYVLNSPPFPEKEKLQSACPIKRYSPGLILFPLASEKQNARSKMILRESKSN